LQLNTVKMRIAHGALEAVGKAEISEDPVFEARRQVLLNLEDALIHIRLQVSLYGTIFTAANS
jgi:hypothetical protein